MIARHWLRSMVDLRSALNRISLANFANKYVFNVIKLVNFFVFLFRVLLIFKVELEIPIFERNKKILCGFWIILRKVEIEWHFKLKKASNNTPIDSFQATFQNEFFPEKNLSKLTNFWAKLTRILCFFLLFLVPKGS